MLNLIEIYYTLLYYATKKFCKLILKPFLSLRPIESEPDPFRWSILLTFL